MKPKLVRSKTLFQLTIVPFEPKTAGPNKDVPKRKQELSRAIQRQVSEAKLAKIRASLKGQLVKVTIIFYLWKGSPKTSDTRPVKDLDNLLKIPLDVLGKDPEGLGLLEEDSYACEVVARKELVNKETDEGYQIRIEKFNDKEMLSTLSEYYERKRSIL